nr:hypothetical protein [uncultured Draconibacterium sp.]
MKKLILHIGYPKTATTTFQLNLFAQLHKEGKIEYLNHLNKSTDYLGDYYCKNIISYILTGTRNDEYLDELELLKSIDQKVVVISNENLSFFSENFSWAYSNSKAINNIKRIKNVFQNIFDIEIIMTIRSQITMIPSFYTQQYFNIIEEVPKFKNFDRWFTENFHEKSCNDVIFNYNSLYNSYKKEFGENNIHVLLFEDLKENKNRICQQLSDIFDITPKIILEAIEGKAQNISKRSNALMYVDNPSLEKLLKIKIKYLLNRVFSRQSTVVIGRAIKKLIPKKLLSIELKKDLAIGELTSENINYIYDLFENENRSIGQNLNIDNQTLLNYKYLKQ